MRRKGGKGFEPGLGFFGAYLGEARLESQAKTQSFQAHWQAFAGKKHIYTFNLKISLDDIAFSS
ncbi:MAG: hypothetical protein OHK0053_32760 [Microscillaceae bacterium]